MVYRFSWLTGLVALTFAFMQLNDLLRPTTEGVPWQFVVIAAAVLGIIITWSALSYRLPAWVVILLNGAALTIAITRVSSPQTSRLLLPTPDTFTLLDAQLRQALDVIRSGVEPVVALTGIVIVVMTVMWVTGIILAWGLLRGHPYVALIPPLVLTLQFATMNRGPSALVEIVLFVALVAATILAIATDERSQTVGRMAPRGAWPSTRSTPPVASFGMLGVTVVAALVSVQVFQGLAPPDGWLDWRDERGLGTGYFGSISYNPFVSIQQSLVSQSNTPVFQARITGDVAPREVYFQLVTMDTYNGGQFFAEDTPLETLEQFPYENPNHAFFGPVATVTTDIQIERLRQEWLPSTYAVTSVAAGERLLRDLRVRPEDASVVFPGGLTFEGMQYRITSSIPQPDLDVLATDVNGGLSVAFAFAQSSAVLDRLDTSRMPTPTRPTAVQQTPPDVDRYLQLPDANEVNRLDEVEALAQERTQNLTTDFERALALEAWFHDPTQFQYRLLAEDEVGHGASDLAAWLLDDASPNHRQGYCENFATAMAVMARTLEIPSRVILGFTPGEPTTADPNIVVVRDRNAHAWVELWMPNQGWVRFDPTPRSARDTLQTWQTTNDTIGFDLTPYLEVPADAVNFPEGGGGLPPQFAPEDEPPLPNFTDDLAGGSGGAFDLPGWVSTVLLWLTIAAAVVAALPALKWWQRRRRMARLRDGDITAAWEDIVARLDDLGDRVSATATPHEVADTIDPAMRPLASVYGRAVYGPDGGITPAHVDAATRSLADTTMRLKTRYSPTKRTLAWYRIGSMLPPRLQRRRARR